MATSHVRLVKKAREILRGRGFTDNEIYEEFWFKNYRIDVVGWNDKQKVAVECGYCIPEKYEELKKFFDEVIHLPFEKGKEPLADSETEALKITDELNEYKVLYALSDPKRTEILQHLIRAYPNRLTISKLQKAMSQPRMTVWFHIKKLRKANLVELNGSGEGFRATTKALMIRFNGDGIHLEEMK